MKSGSTGNKYGSKLAYMAPLAVLAFAIGLIIYSPYQRHPGFDYRLMLHTVDIAAPPDSVFRYLGNPANAESWSVFVDHITPLNADSIPDGNPGSRRRNFCRKDETGKRWDETITEVIPGKKRRLAMHDFVGFSASSDSLATEQLYEPLPDGGCRLTFTLFLTGRPKWGESLQMFFAAYSIKNIFSRDLANIKRIIEKGS